MKIVKHLVDAAKGKHPITRRRSPEWPKVERAYKKTHPACEICGRTNRIQVHHKKPFHLYPELELDPDNLIALCEPVHHAMKCHLLAGHGGNFKLFNPDIATDAPRLRERLKEIRAQHK